MASPILSDIVAMPYNRSCRINHGTMIQQNPKKMATARERVLRSAAVRAVAILLGFCCIIVPWLIRQDRLYGIATISDNIGEAIYAASSPVYKQWTTRIRKDADAAGIPNTVGDRYRYFMERAVENVKANPMFYVRNVATSFWEYANPFGLRSRTGTQYGNPFSSAAEGQRLLLPYVI